MENQLHLLKANLQLWAISNDFLWKVHTPSKEVVVFVTYFSNIPKTV